jgi:16S rRNA A1518/A1519 N6-dimethyltransferase RsmA/KsgA/DIM1 with predicted DNA glycosylase/AP lyase activity
MKAKQASKKKRLRKPPVVKAFSPAPDVVSVHIRAEPEQVADLMPHSEDPKTLFQKLADWFNNNN